MSPLQGFWRGLHCPIPMWLSAMQVMQEVQSRWTSGRLLPNADSATPSGTQHTRLHSCLASINTAIACRRDRAHNEQVAYCCKPCCLHTGTGCYLFLLLAVICYGQLPCFWPASTLPLLAANTGPTMSTWLDVEQLAIAI